MPEIQRSTVGCLPFHFPSAADIGRKVRKAFGRVVSYFPSSLKRRKQETPAEIARVKKSTDSNTRNAVKMSPKSRRNASSKGATMPPLTREQMRDQRAQYDLIQNPIQVLPASAYVERATQAETPVASKVEMDPRAKKRAAKAAKKNHQSLKEGVKRLKANSARPKTAQTNVKYMEGGFLQAHEQARVQAREEARRTQEFAKLFDESNQAEKEQATPSKQLEKTGSKRGSLSQRSDGNVSEGRGLSTTSFVSAPGDSGARVRGKSRMVESAFSDSDELDSDSDELDVSDSEAPEAETLGSVKSGRISDLDEDDLFLARQIG